jgi:hypothetical protein
MVKKESHDPYRYEMKLLFLPPADQLDYLEPHVDLLMNMWTLGNIH